MPIPASTLVSVNSGVLAPGGSGLTFAGMYLTQNAYLPGGPPTSFATAKGVSDYFGSGSAEYAAAQVYFQGYDGSAIKPGLLWFARYPEAATAAFLRGSAVISLTALQAITAGHLSVTIDGTPKSTTTLDLSGAGSFSVCASDIATALGLSGGQTCTYSSQFNAFVITSGTTGAASTITFGVSNTGTAATVLGLTQAAGAVDSQGQDASSSQSAFMDTLLTYTANWVTLYTIWDTTLADKKGFASWVSAQNTRFLYAVSDSDATIVQTPSAFTGFAHWAAANSISGSFPVYNSLLTASAVAGIVASTDFTQTNGRVNFMFRTNNLIGAAVITDVALYNNMIANGYSTYCNFAVDQQPNMLANGQITGPYLWADSYIGAIHLAVSIQAAEIALLQQQKSLPYNKQGYTLISAAALDPINSALNFGSIRAGVTPSASEAAQMNAAAGANISGTVGTRGWYLQVLPADATTRTQRKSPPISLWFMDGQSIQQLNIASIDVL